MLLVIIFFYQIFPKFRGFEIFELCLNLKYDRNFGKITKSVYGLQGRKNQSDFVINANYLQTNWKIEKFENCCFYF